MFRRFSLHLIEMTGFECTQVYATSELGHFLVSLLETIFPSFANVLWKHFAARKIAEVFRKISHVWMIYHKRVTQTKGHSYFYFWNSLIFKQLCNSFRTPIFWKILPSNIFMSLLSYSYKFFIMWITFDWFFQKWVAY